MSWETSLQGCWFNSPYLWHTLRRSTDRNSGRTGQMGTPWAHSVKKVGNSRLQGCLVLDEPEAELVWESDDPSDSDSVPLSSKPSALASSAAPPVVASPCSMIQTTGCSWRGPPGHVVVTSSSDPSYANNRRFLPYPNIANIVVLQIHKKASTIFSVKKGEEVNRKNWYKFGVYFCTNIQLISNFPNPKC